MGTGQVWRCVHCGYDMASVMVVNPHAPCPECGDARPPDLTPWPPRAQVIWQMARVPVATALICAVSLFSGAMVVCLLPFVVIIGGGVLIAYPFHEAAQLVRRHSPELGRTRIYMGLLGLGWFAGLASLTVIFLLLLMVRAVVAIQ